MLKHSKNNFQYLLFGLCTAFGLLTNLELPEAAEAGIQISLYQQLYKLLEIISVSLAGKGLLLTILTCLFTFVYYKVWHKKEGKAARFTKGVAFVLAILYMVGLAYAFADTITVYASLIRLLFGVIGVIGFYALYLTVINCFYGLLHSSWDSRVLTGRLGSHVVSWYQRKPYLFCFGLIMISWLVHLILRYPGTMSYDNANQLAYFFGYQEFTTAQPVFHTVLFGAFIQLGLWFGSENVGLFLFVVFQSTMMAAVLAYSQLLMKGWSTPRWLRTLTMGIYCIAPYYAGYASFPIKDYLYTACFVMLFLLLLEWYQKEKQDGVMRVLWILAGSFLILMRNNGLYIYLSIFVLVLILFAGRRKQNILLLLLPLVLSGLITGGLEAAFHVEKDSPKEMFSLPFQQTARYVRDFGEDVTLEQREAIAAVLDYDKLPTVYMELTADPVKTTYHAENSAELAAYFKVWFEQLLQHPLCYAEATMNQNYYLFAPNIDNIVYNKDCMVAHEVMEELGMKEQICFSEPSFMHGLCAIMVSWYSFVSRFPVLGLLNNVAFYMILLLVMTFFTAAEGKKKSIWLFVPLWATFLMILLSPQIQNQPRYAFPIIYVMPSVVAFYVLMIKGKKSEWKQDEA